ncbi:MAG: hypothetical protein R2705_14190 [Ilumatobacteraceae bacterium]
MRDAGGVDFVLLDLDRATAVARVAGRSDHFMGPSMVASQFDTLEPPGPDEDDVVSVDGSAPIATVVTQSLAGLAASRVREVTAARSPDQAWDPTAASHGTTGRTRPGDEASRVRPPAPGARRA